MAETWQLAFVDSISATANIRLNLHSGTRGPFNLRDGSRFDPPPLKRSIPQSMLADGGIPTSAVYDNRTIVLNLQVMSGGAMMAADPAAAQLQLLMRELDRPGNILRLQPGTAAPVFFRTYRSGPDVVEFDPVTREVTVTLLAEPFAYGLEETLAAVTVYNDPADGVTLNSNPFFETNATGWTATGGTFARSTAQFHEGAASGLLTPSGAANSVFVECEETPVVSGQVVRGSAWLRNPTARNVQLRIDWYDAAHAFNNQTTLQSTSVTANTWTYFDGVGTAPVTGYARLTPFEAGTPVPAADLIYVDEARLRIPGSSGAMYLDVASPKGDVETPLYLTFAGNMGFATGNEGFAVTGVAVRRRGTVTAAPLVLQAEAMTMAIADTTVQANSTLMSGAGSNFVRTTFATATAMSTRIQTAAFPAAASVDARGTYRVFARVRQNTGTDVMALRLTWGSSTVSVTNATVTLGQDTGASAPTIKYVDLGLIQIPVGYDPVYDGVSGVELPAAGVFLAVQAQRVSGSGSLDWDLLLALPADDRLEMIQWPTVQNSPTDVFVAEGGPRPAVYCVDVNGSVVSTPPVQISGVGMMLTPGRTNRVYVARDVGLLSYSTGPGDSISKTTVVGPSYFPRYLFPLKPVST